MTDNLEKLHPEVSVNQQKAEAFATRWRAERKWVEAFLNQLTVRMKANPPGGLVDTAFAALEMTAISYEDGHSEPVDPRRLLAMLLMYSQQMRQENAVLADMIEAMRQGKVQ